jgi:hypothetical protein
VPLEGVLTAFKLAHPDDGARPKVHLVEFKVGIWLQRKPARKIIAGVGMPFFVPLMSISTLRQSNQCQNWETDDVF